MNVLNDGISRLVFAADPNPCKLVVVQNNVILYDTGWCGDDSVGNQTQSIIDAELTRRGLPPETFTGFSNRVKDIDVLEDSIQLYFYDIPQTGLSTSGFVLECPV